VDRRHRDELRAAIDRMPLAKRHENILAISAFQTVELVRRIFEGLVGGRMVRAGAGVFTEQEKTI
jgi:hypothetical protein